jgi:transposase-like protein
VNEEYPENYTVKADIMDDTEIRELFEELLSNVRKYYTDAYREVLEVEEQENIRSAATRAWHTFRSLFPNQPELDLDFLSREGEDAAESIVSTLVEWAMAGLDNQPGGRNRLEQPRVASHADECMDLLDSLTTDHSSGDGTALWPFVKLIRYKSITRLSEAI